MLVIPPREGEVIGDAPDRRVELLSDVDPLHATWSRFGPRRAGANLHVHYHHSDLFYVLEGELTVMLGPDGDESVAPAGTLARVPPLVVHGFRNGSDAELRYLNFHAPGQGFADYMRGLADFDQVDPPEDGGRPASEAPLTGGEGVLCDVDEIGIAVLTSPPDGAHVHREHVESHLRPRRRARRQRRARAGRDVAPDPARAPPRDLRLRALPRRAHAELRSRRAGSAPGVSRPTCRDVLGDVLGVARQAVDHRRRDRVQEQQADEVQAGLVGDDAAFGDRVVAGDAGQIDPVEIGIEPGAPDDVRHVDRAAVLEPWQAVARAGDPGHALDLGGGEVVGFGAHEREAVREHLGALLATHRRPHGHHAVEEAAQDQREDEAGR